MSVIVVFDTGTVTYLGMFCVVVDILCKDA